MVVYFQSLYFKIHINIFLLMFCISATTRSIPSQSEIIANNLFDYKSLHNKSKEKRMRLKQGCKNSTFYMLTKILPSMIYYRNPDLRSSKEQLLSWHFLTQFLITTICVRLYWYFTWNLLWALRKRCIVFLSLKDILHIASLFVQYRRYCHHLSSSYLGMPRSRSPKFTFELSPHHLYFDC